MPTFRPRSIHRTLLIAMASLAVLAGCGREPATDVDAPPAADDGLAPLPARFEGAWRGVLPCVDCEGLDVTLELQREADAAGRYRLVEAYLGAGDAPEFEVSGEWRESSCRLGDDDGQCVELLESGQRWFRHADGSLQAVDADGLPLDPDGARLMRR